MGLFSTKCPVNAAEKLWVEQRLCWLAEAFGFHRLLDTEVVLPTEEWFPEIYSASDEDVEAMFAYVCELMQLDRHRFELFFSDDPDASGTYQFLSKERIERISIRSDQAADPMSLVATISHELAHAMLIGEQNISSSVLDHEWVTDLTTVFTGMGVFGANCVIRETTDHLAMAQITSTSGYMSEKHYGYALAVFAWSRGEIKPTWAYALSPNVRAIMKQGLKYLWKTNDSLIGPEGFTQINFDSESISIQEMVDEFEAGSDSDKLRIVRKIRRLGHRPKEFVEPLTEIIGMAGFALIDEAADLLGSYGMAAEAAVPLLLHMSNSRDRDLNMIIARTLGEIGAKPELALLELERGIAAQDYQLRFASTMAIGKFGEQAAGLVNRLNESIEEMYFETMRAPIITLGEIGVPAQMAVPNLVRVLNEGEGDLRDAAATALGKIGDRSDAVVLALLGIVDDDDSHVRNAALEALAKLDPNHSKVGRALVRASNQNDLETQIIALNSLALVNGHAKTSIEGFARLILPILCPTNSRTYEESMVDIYSHVRLALDGIDGAVVRPLLNKLAVPDESQSLFAIWALGRIGPNENVSNEILSLTHESKTILWKLFCAFAQWNVCSQGKEAIQIFMDCLSAIDLSEPMDRVFHLCEIKNDSHRNLIADPDRLAGPQKLYRDVIHVAIREMGSAAIRPLMDQLKKADKQELCEEIAILLGAIQHASTADFIESEIRAEPDDLELRKWLSYAQDWKTGLASRQRQFEMMTLELPVASQQDTMFNEVGNVEVPIEMNLVVPAPIHEFGIHNAEWLLVNGNYQMHDLHGMR